MKCYNNIAKSMWRAIVYSSVNERAPQLRIFVPSPCVSVCLCMSCCLSHSAKHSALTANAMPSAHLRMHVRCVSHSQLRVSPSLAFADFVRLTPRFSPAIYLVSEIVNSLLSFFRLFFSFAFSFECVQIQHTSLLSGFAGC